MIVNYDYFDTLRPEIKLIINALVNEFKSKNIKIDMRKKGGVQPYINIEQLIKEGNIIKKYVIKLGMTRREVSGLLATLFNVSIYYFMCRIKITKIIFDAINLYYSNAISFYDIYYMSVYSEKKQRQFLKRLLTTGIIKKGGGRPKPKLKKNTDKIAWAMTVEAALYAKEHNEEPVIYRAPHSLIELPKGRTKDAELKEYHELTKDKPPEIVTYERKEGTIEAYSETPDFYKDNLEMVIPDNIVHENNYSKWKKENHIE